MARLYLLVKMFVVFDEDFTSPISRQLLVQSQQKRGTYK